MDGLAQRLEFGPELEAGLVRPPQPPAFGLPGRHFGPSRR